jgi:hypothetical protein
MNNLKGKKIFLIDAMGATVSILCLYVLYSFEELFGMPKSVLNIFMLMAMGFSGYSFTCYFVNLPNWRLYLVIIAILNISYCLFTIYHLFQNSSSITFLGYTYFMAELVIVFMLSFYELKLSRETTN